MGVFSAETPDNATVERSGAGSGSGSGSGAGSGVGSGSGRFRGSYCLLLGSRYEIGPCRWCRAWVDLMPTRAQGAWGVWVLLLVWGLCGASHHQDEDEVLRSVARCCIINGDSVRVCRCMYDSYDD